MWTRAAGSSACAVGSFSPALVESVELSNVETNCQPHISGIYTKNEQIVNERPTYTQPGEENAFNLHIYHLDGKWRLSPIMESVYNMAYITSDSATLFAGNWQVYCNDAFYLSSMFFRLYDNADACEACPVTFTTVAGGNTSASDRVCNAGKSPHVVEYVEISMNESEVLCIPHVSGIYTKNQQVLNGRPTYTKPEGVDFSDYHVYYLDGYWAISSPDIGSFNIRAHSTNMSATVPLGNWQVVCSGNMQISSMAFRLYDEFESCIQCPLGKFKEMPGNTECEACPAPQTTAAEGSASPSDCSCAAGSSSVATEHVELSNVESVCQAFISGIYTKNELIMNNRATYTKPASANAVARHIYHVNAYWRLSSTMGANSVNAYQPGASGTLPLANWKVHCKTPSSSQFQDSSMVFRLYDVYSACEQCPVGKIKDTVGFAACESCPADQTTAGEGSARAQDCICDAGFSPGHDEGGVACAQCPAGTFKGAVGGAACETCPINQTTAAEGSTSPRNCLCAPGFSSQHVDIVKISGGEPCQSSINGLYAQTPAMFNDKPTYAKTVWVNSTCLYIFFVANYWAVATSIGDVSGRAHVQTTTTSPTVPMGNWNVLCGASFQNSSIVISLHAAPACEQCPTGKFSNSLNATCAECPARSTTAAPASTSAGHCLCNAGYTGDAALACTACMPGTFKEGAGAMVCENCSTGQYSSAEASASCSMCPPQSTTAGMGSPSEHDCVCNAGYTMLPSVGCAFCDQPAQYSIEIG